MPGGDARHCDPGDFRSLDRLQLCGGARSSPDGDILRGDAAGRSVDRETRHSLSPGGGGAARGGGAGEGTGPAGAGGAAGVAYSVDPRSAAPEGGAGFRSDCRALVRALLPAQRLAIHRSVLPPAPLRTLHFRSLAAHPAVVVLSAALPTP